MIAATALALLLQAPASQAAPFDRLWTDWRAVSRQSSASEKVEAEAARAPKTATEQAEAVARGERVGEVVASGDCAIGERLAREAGDIPLARAVRAHCYGERKPPPTRQQP